jgi:hypothetical protein
MEEKEFINKNKTFYNNKEKEGKEEEEEEEEEEDIPIEKWEVEKEEPWKKYILEIIKNYKDNFDLTSIKNLNKNQESIRLIYRNYFHHFTPLNKKLEPLIQKYLELEKIRNQNFQKNKKELTLKNKIIINESISNETDPLSPLYGISTEEKLKFYFNHGEYNEVLKLFLQNDQWDKAIEFMEKYCQIDSEKNTTDISKQLLQVELFEILLNYCLEMKYYSRCSHIWKYMPNCFNSKKLIMILYKYFSKKENKLSPPILFQEENKENQCTISLFRPQLIKMLNEEKNTT